jgi:NADH-quinone oxidoreductase subunit M
MPFRSYIYFEAVLSDVYYYWGLSKPVFIPAFKFFLYTLLGSVLMLFALLYLYMEAAPYLKR